MALKIVGAGLGRTGTMSLKAALEQLGFGPCYHMVEVMMNPECIPLWIQSLDGAPDWEAIFKGYGATVDYPACAHWRELSQFYPQAKVLLSVRDPDRWFESTQATIFSEGAMRMMGNGPMREFVQKGVWKEFGERIHDRDFMVAAFKRHNTEVEQSIPKDRLLVYEVSQGWEPLCKFLDVPVPAAPFPRMNSREEMAAMMASHNTSDPNAPLDFKRLQESIRARLQGS